MKFGFGLLAFLCACSGAWAQPTFSASDLDTIRQKATAADFSGVIYIMEKGKEVFHFANGSVKKDRKLAPTTDTRFNLGSIGKTITSLLIMQLVENKKLQLDVPISHYLPPQDTLPNRHLITVRQLLSHTSGLGDFFSSPHFSEEKTISIDDHFKLVQQMKPVNDTPGKQFIYSNAGFIVLGKLLELQYQKPYQKIVEEQVLQPARIDIKANQTHATGYKQVNGQWVVGEGNNPARWTSAGGIFLSVKELDAIIRNVVENKYVSAPIKDSMWKPAIHPQGEPPFVNYGLGWMVEEPFGVLLLGHNGGVPGFQAAFRYLPESNLLMYALSNQENGVEPIFMHMIMTLVQKNKSTGKGAGENNR